MQHCDPDVLGLAALGEALDARDSEHLASCAECRAALDDLVRIVDGVRVDVPAGPSVTPPPEVWEAIAARTGVTVRPQLEPPASSVPASSVPAASVPAAPGSELPASPVPSVPGSPVPGSPVPVLPGPARRDRPGRRGTVPAGRWRLLAVAAATLVIGAVGGSLVTRAVIERPAGRTVVMQVQLAALPLAPDAAGSAVVVRGVHGRDLVVDVSRLGTRPGQFYEVWLIDRTVHKMVAVGILDGAEGRFSLPASVDLDEYPVVDISVQQPGDPRHSGRSVLRGTLPA